MTLGTAFLLTGNRRDGNDELLGSFEFRGTSHVFGTVRVTYTVNDGQRDSDAAQFDIVIAPVDDAPTGIFISGDRNVDNTEGNNEDGEGALRYALTDGRITLRDGTEGGALTADDVEGGDSPFTDEDGKELTHVRHFESTKPPATAICSKSPANPSTCRRQASPACSMAT